MVQLFNYLKHFSSNLVAKTKEVEGAVDTLVTATKAADVKLHNTFNEFLLLANSQYIENVRTALLLSRSRSLRASPRTRVAFAPMCASQRSVCTTPRRKCTRLPKSRSRWTPRRWRK
jgi:hypothetical protein